MIHWKLLLLAVLIFLVEQVHGQDLERIGTGRPDQTQGTTVVPEGTLQLESGLQYEKNATEEQDARTRAYPSVSLRYGLLDNLELRLQSSYQDSVIREDGGRRTVSGTGPLQAGFRLYMWDGAGWLPQAAFTATVAVPVTKSSMASDYAATAFRLGFTNTITSQLSLTYTVGYGWVQEGNETKYAVKLSGDLSEHIAAYGEVYGTKASKSRPYHQTDAGLLFLVRHNMQLDVAAGVGLSRAAPDFFITTGFSVRLPR